MSWKDEEIDALFKSAHAPEAPAFQEIFWNEMEAMLPQKKRRKTAVWWFSGAAVGVLLVTGLWFISGSDVKMDHVTTTNLHGRNEQLSLGKQLLNKGNMIYETAPGLSETEPVMPVVRQSFTLTIPTPAIVFPEPVEEITPEIQAVVEETVVQLHSDESVTIDGLPRLPVTTSGELVPVVNLVAEQPERFYIQVNAGIGQSAQRAVVGRSGFLHYYAIGAGLYQNVGNIYVTFGVKGRIDFAQNIVHSATLSSAMTHTETKYAQLYAFETPLSVGYKRGANRFAVTFDPGIQFGFTGNYTEYDEDNAVVRSGRTSGKLKQTKTLTMEMGVSYLREVRSNWYIGGTCSADAIRAFGDGSFYGEQRLLPVNGSVVVRRTF